MSRILLIASLFAGLGTVSTHAAHPKRGWAGSEWQKTEATNNSWYYTWGVLDNPSTQAVAEYVPLFYSANSVTQANVDKIASYQIPVTHVLGMNEPEYSSQGNTTVPQAIAAWPTLQSTNLRVGSPANLSDLNWGASFNAQVDALNSNADPDDDLTVDFTAFHWYGNSDHSWFDINDPQKSADRFLDRVDYWWTTYNRPLWITEFGFQDPSGSISEAAWGVHTESFLRIVLPALDSIPHVERYAWFQWGDPYSARRLYAGSTPTNLGILWSDGTLTGDTRDLNGVSMGEDRMYMRGGILTNGAASVKNAVKYFDVLAPDGVHDDDAVISGTGDWSFDSTGWARVRSGATLRKLGSNEVSIVGLNFENAGVIDVAVGSLKFASDGQITGTGRTSVSASGKLSLGSLPNRSGIVLSQAMDLRGGTIEANPITDGIHTVTAASTVHQTSTLGGTGTLFYTGPLLAPNGGGGGGIIKSGHGSVYLTAANTYQGDTIVEQGTLFLTGSGSIANSAKIDVRPGGTLDVSGLSSTFTVTNGQTLNNDSDTTVSGDVIAGTGATVSGVGTFVNNVTVNNGATLQVSASGLQTTPGPSVFSPLDEFNGDSSADYTKYVVLDNGNDADISSSDSALVVNGGTASVVTTIADDVEQQLYRHQATPLGVGEELWVDIANIESVTSRDMGLFVGNAADLADVTSATPGTRKNFVYITGGSNESSGGFNSGGASIGSSFGISLSDGDTLFIAHTDGGEFELGHYDNDNSLGGGAGARVVEVIRIGLAENNASALGFWADVRAAGVLSQFDNLGIYAPTPVSLGGTMTIQGDLVLDAGSTLELDIASTTIHDVLEVSGVLTVGGTLDVALAVDTPEPNLGDVFDILDFDQNQVYGSFDQYHLPSLTSGLVWNITDLLTTGELEVVRDVDLDNDGFVTGNDFLLIQLSNSSLIADWNDQYGNHVVDGTSQASTTAGVPEPMTIGLLAIGWIAIVNGRSRCRLS